MPRGRKEVSNTGLHAICKNLLGYAEWRNFNQSAISKAKTACEVSGHLVADHFVDVNKMVEFGSGSQREIEDVLPPAEDVKQVERRLASDEKKSLKNPGRIE